MLSRSLSRVEKIEKGSDGALYRELKPLELVLLENGLSGYIMRIGESSLKQSREPVSEPPEEEFPLEWAPAAAESIIPPVRMAI
jgi:hypothetical protein